MSDKISTKEADSSISSEESLEKRRDSLPDKGTSYWDKVRGWIGTKESGRSAMSFWSDRFGHDTVSPPTIYGDSDADLAYRFERIMTSIRRTANLFRPEDTEVDNFKGKDSPAFSVKWAGANPGEEYRNKADSTDVYVSTDIVNRKTTLKREWTDDELTDVTISHVLTETALKYTLPLEVERKMIKRCSKNVSGREKLYLEMWTLLEKLAAEQLVLDQYPGFRPYMAAEREYYSSQKARKTLQRDLDLTEKVQNLPHPRTGIDALQWMLLHPNPDRKFELTIPAKWEELYKKAIRMATKAIEGSSKDRSSLAIPIVELFFDDIEKDRSSGGSEQKKKEGSGRAGESGPEGSGSGEQTDSEREAKPNPESSDDPSKESRPSKDEKTQLGWDKVVRGSTLEIKSSKKLLACIEGNPITDNMEGEEFDWKGGTIEMDPDPERSMSTGYGSYYSGASYADQYSQLVAEFSPEIRSLKSRLKIQAEEQKIMEHGLRRGKLDEGSLYKLGFYNLGYEDPGLFENEEIKDKPSIAFCLLVDESGSMSGSGRESARRAAIILANALKSIPGANFCVLGHTAQGTPHEGKIINSVVPNKKYRKDYSDVMDFSFSHNELVINHYHSPVSQKNMTKLAMISAYAENLDGFAISLSAKRMLEWYPHCKRKVLIHLNDGLPSAQGYRGHPAVRHTQRVVTKVRRMGIQVLCVAIGEHPVADYDAMYGRNNYIFVNVHSAMAPLGNFITSSIRQANVL